ncbi:HemK Methylase of polypeptide chain release factors [Pyrenophora tritici-repentis]|uniref:HemK, Methylase polypeptide chain release factor n=1 Tax=Pyrenophora tritici-repentis TaxID=45151 RepID=A0A2W1GKH6_9PLEO|nr:SAM-dependent methyltransferase [Pyrenophora tritici-repentis]KAF7576803.1 HemK, Methylase polypeptide chain release factor [Pyrenophora tritici-repentis]KAI0620216.1 SAM-dependent methyltransferase [Pyrenophora tritici-repentis]KAI1520591.1 SAM-dependent methyltransferase [Pyrenophora tritici-repentis]KAI1544036.1 HemK Methylase of polypeptide chain release factors [Pyrenophora tritici-repentis]
MAESTTYQALASHLSEANYHFICPSPETQGRIVSKRRSNASTEDAQNAHDFFGWNLPCTRLVIEVLRSMIPDEVFESLYRASIITQCNDRSYRSTIRISDFYLPGHASDSRPHYYVHSSFPASSDSVFFGPDTYLFVSFLQSVARHVPQVPSSIIDVCCGSGAGAIHMARTYPLARTLGLDLNPRALSLGNINAHLAGVEISFAESNLYNAVPQDMKSYGVDLIVSNPPYIASSTDDEDLPMYADGGATFGLNLSIQIVEEGMKLMSSSGIIVIYTGVAIPTSNPGHDAFLEKLKSVEGAEVAEYTILHPDMWSEEIGKGAYADACRIQVVGAVLRRNAKSVGEVKSAARRRWAV